MLKSTSRPSGCAPCCGSNRGALGRDVAADAGTAVFAAHGPGAKGRAADLQKASIL
jgi:hypothetical protein